MATQKKKPSGGKNGEQRGRDEDDQPRENPAEGSVYEEGDYEQQDNFGKGPAPLRRRGGKTGLESRQSKSAKYK